MTPPPAGAEAARQPAWRAPAIAGRACAPRARGLGWRCWRLAVLGARRLSASLARRDGPPGARTPRPRSPGPPSSVRPRCADWQQLARGDGAWRCVRTLGVAATASRPGEPGARRSSDGARLRALPARLLDPASRARRCSTRSTTARPRSSRSTAAASRGGSGASRRPTASRRLNANSKQGTGVNPMKAGISRHGSPLTAAPADASFARAPVEGRRGDTGCLGTEQIERRRRASAGSPRSWRWSWPWSLGRRAALRRRRRLQGHGRVPERLPARQGQPGRRRRRPRRHGQATSTSATTARRWSSSRSTPTTRRCARGTTRQIRSTSLSAVAGRQVQLDPARRRTRPAPDDRRRGQLSPSPRPISEVDLDQLFNTLSPKTINDFKHVIQGFDDLLRRRRPSRPTTASTT